MKEKQVEKLTPHMQDRLEKWRKNIFPMKNVEHLKKKWPLKLRQVRRDYGDDISDFAELSKTIREGK